MKPVVLAVGCHPDDIEFMMGGTLFLLKAAGCTCHYMNLANGNCGTSTLNSGQIRKIRREEAKAAAALLGGEYHDSITSDLEVFYSQKLIRRLVYVIRKVQPDIMLVHSPEDYMEDHMNTCRISVTAAFCRGIRNYHSRPKAEPIFKDVVLYHALPYGLTDWVKVPIIPQFYIDVASVIEKKKQMLACHVSQKVWLDESQGQESYLIAMKEMSAKVGERTGKFEYAEGWRIHSHLGFSEKPEDPLGNILSDYYLSATE